jgi:hypothetical protein
MQAASMPQEEFEQAQVAANVVYHTFTAVPSEAFPLFLRSRM